MNLWKPKLKTIPFIISAKKIKYLHINLTKHVQDLCAKNNKILIKEIKEDLNKWRGIPSSCIEGLSLVKVSTDPKLVCRFKALPIKTLAKIFVGIDKLILKFV